MQHTAEVVWFFACKSLHWLSVSLSFGSLLPVQIIYALQPYFAFTVPL